MSRILKSSKSAIEELESASQSVSVTSSAPVAPTLSATASTLISDRAGPVTAGGAPLHMSSTGTGGSSSLSSGSESSLYSAPIIGSESVPFTFGGENFFSKPAAFGGTTSSSDGASGKPAFVPGELIIRFAASDSLQGQAFGIQKALMAIGGRVEEWLTSANNGDGSIALRVSVDKAIGLERAIEMLTKVTGVLAAEHNWIFTTQATANETSYKNGNLWGMYGDGTSPANANGSQAGEAWAADKIGSMKTVIGIIDEGLDYTHPDLYLNVWLNQGEIRELSFFGSLQDTDSDGIITFRDLNNSLNARYVTDINKNGRIDADDLLRDTRWANGKDSPFDSNGYVDDLVGWDFVGNDNRPFDGKADDHGTHVAGTIGAMGGNGTGVVGVNWQVQMMSLKFLGSAGGSTSNAINAVNYFTNAAFDNLKYGWGENFVGTSNSWGGGGYSSTLLGAIVNAAKADLFFVAAAGNNSSNNDLTPSYPASYSTLSAVGYESVVSVASITNLGALSSFSNYGNTSVDIGAPGSSIYSTLPGSSYGTYSGTSMATPHVSGALALLASIFPTATAADLISVLLGTGAPTASLDGKTVTGDRLDLGAMSSISLSSSLLTQNQETLQPTLVLGSQNTTLKANDLTTLTFRFSELITNFDLNDIVATGNAGKISGLTTSDYQNWTATYTANASISSRTTVDISVFGNSYTDLAGNFGAENKTLQITVG